MKLKILFSCNERCNSWKAEVQFNMLKSETSLGSCCRTEVVKV